MTHSGTQVYEFGPFRLDRQERVLLRDGRPVPLRPKDFDMLLVLVENGGRVIEKDELMKRVWPETFVEEANLSHYVFALRKALGDEKDEARYIETVPRRGYRFVAPVTAASNDGAGAAARDGVPLPAVAIAGDAPSALRTGLLAPPRPWDKPLMLAAVIAVAVAAAYGGRMLRPVPAPPVTRTAITLAAGDRFTDVPSTALALSPDGTRLVYAANGRLYLRPLDRLEASPIPGVERPGLASARAPVFSPDGQWVAFWEQRQLKKVSIHGGGPVVLCDLGPPPYGLTWASDNTILIGHGSRGLWRVPADGGTPATIFSAGEGQRVHGPHLLPDGRSVLFTLARSASWDESEIVVQSLDTGTRRTIDRGADARYLPTGHLVYALRDTVHAVRFDAATVSITGPSVALVEGIQRRDGAFGSAAQFAVAPNGTMAYLESKKIPPPQRMLVWVDRLGREEPLPAEPRAYIYARISPDGSRLALDIEGENRDIWVWDFLRRTLTRVTTDPTRDVEPLWTSDGQRLIYLSLRTGMGNLFWQSADGSGTAEQLTAGSRIRGADAVTSDRKLVLRESDGEGTFDLALLDLPEARLVQPASSGSVRLVQSPHAESNAEVSPNGRWLAYQSNKSGSTEVYLRTFGDAPVREWPVSSGGGTEPLWARSSRELFYRGPRGAVMRVAITAASPVPVSTPSPLFDGASYALGGQREFAGLLRRTYDVSVDGRRFLMIRNQPAPPPSPTPERIVLVQSWFTELKSKLPPD